MICKKIVYFGNFDEVAAAKIFDIARKNEITGEIKKISANQVQLNLEGDASYIKLVQHQIEHSLKDKITNKEVVSADYKNFKGISFKV